MPLFQVPQWSNPDGPAKAPRKRKRASASNQSTNTASEEAALLQSAARSFDKLINQFGADPSPDGAFKKRETERQDDRSTSRHQPHAFRAAISVQTKPSVKRNKEKKGGYKTTKNSADDSSSQKAKAGNVVHRGKSPNVEGQDAHLTIMQKKMKESLDGARFRWINERLYKAPSAEAKTMMRDDPSVYSAYHAGFRYQVKSWPVNPVNQFVDKISNGKRNAVVVDLGCGDAALAKALIPKGFPVISFDLVSEADFVVEADICRHIPLPGSEQDARGDNSQIVDVVVCSLSLMSTNWVGCIREARRILKTDGLLLVAEVASRFIDVEAFTHLICSIGFRLYCRDDGNSHFIQFEFKKVKREGVLGKDQWEEYLSRGSLLQACEYKRR